MRLKGQMPELPARHLRTVLERTTQVVYLKKADGTYLFVNRRFEQVSHIPRAQILGKKDHEVFPKPIADLFTDQDRQVREKGAPIEFEETVPLPDGPQSWITCKFPLLDAAGKVWAVGGSCTDVTGRKAAEEALRLREAMLSEAEKLAGLGSFEFDVASGRSRRSPGVHAIFGVTAREMGESVDGLLARVHPDDREGLHEALRRWFAVGTPLSTEYRIRRPDGSERIIHAEGHCVKDGSGRPLRCFGWIQDITARRDLETKVLSIADRERRTIGLDLHDDLGQRLTGLALLGRALQNRLSAEGSKEAAPMGEIVRQTQLALCHVRELARGLQPVPSQPEGLRDALASLAANACAGGVSCAFASKEDLLVRDPVAANHLYRIAQEAVANALRHAQARALELTLADEDGALVLTVKDDGVGGARPGKGMGLDIMRHRAMLLQGTLQVSSPPGRGTTVTCRTPIR